MNIHDLSLFPDIEGLAGFIRQKIRLHWVPEARALSRVWPRWAQTESRRIMDEDSRLLHQFDVIIERDDEGYYVASVPQLPGCHTQARSLDEVTQRVREAIELCLEAEGAPERSLEFIGIQRITIAA